MATPQLTPEEIATIRQLREDEELPFAALGKRLGIDASMAHRILTKPGYTFTELVLIRIRKGLRRIEEERAAAAQRSRPRKAAAR